MDSIISILWNYRYWTLGISNCVIVQYNNGLRLPLRQSWFCHQHKFTFISYLEGFGSPGESFALQIPIAWLLPEWNSVQKNGHPGYRTIWCAYIQVMVSSHPGYCIIFVQLVCHDPWFETNYWACKILKANSMSPCACPSQKQRCDVVKRDVGDKNCHPLFFCNLFIRNLGNSCKLRNHVRFIVNILLEPENQCEHS